MGHGAQPAGHAQVDNDGGSVIENDDEVLGAAADVLDDAARDASEYVFAAMTVKNSGEISDFERLDALPDDLVEQGAANGFDLGQFWHTRVTNPRPVRVGGQTRQRTTALPGRKPRSAP